MKEPEQAMKERTMSETAFCCHCDLRRSAVFDAEIEACADSDHGHHWVVNADRLERAEAVIEAARAALENDITGHYRALGAGVRACVECDFETDHRGNVQDEHYPDCQVFMRRQALAAIAEYVGR